MQNNIHQIDEIVTGFNIQDHGDYEQKSNQLMEMFDRDYDQLYVQADVSANFDYWLNDAINYDEPEEMIFFYHKDLPKAFGMGSSTQISDPGANIIQHIEYLPYGECFFERRIDDYWTTPYKFNAKELDAETGMYYYGARYYTPEVSIWLSVDPMAGEYPSLSPYNYCANNPVILIDPNGMNLDNYFIFESGDIVVERTDDETNTYTFVSDDGTHTDLGTYNVEKNTTQSHNGASQEKDMVDLSNINKNFIKNRETVGSEHYLGEDETASLLGAAYLTYKETKKTTYITQYNGLYSSHSGHGSLGDRVDVQYINFDNKGGATWTSFSNYDEKNSQILVNNLMKYGFNRAFTQIGNVAALQNTSFSNKHYHHIHIDANGGIPSRYKKLGGTWQIYENPNKKKSNYRLAY
jgi:RHS repeat-associated protein